MPYGRSFRLEIQVENSDKEKMVFEENNKPATSSLQRYL